MEHAMTTETLTKTQAEGAINDTRKADLLSSPVEHIDITKFDARPIIAAMGKMSFTSRDLARATGLYNQMLEDTACSVILVIAGSTSAGGCMDLYAELVRSNMVDAIVATGAAIVDMDFFEALGHKHYQANEIPDDDTLRSLYIDRIYDTYIDEQQLQDCDFTIGKIADGLEPRPYSSREFIKHMGKWLSEGNGKKDNSLVKLAFEHDVPIFCPAFTDSSAGFGLVKHQVDAMKRGGHYMTLDSIADFRELTDIKIKAGTTGLLMIGGGVPKNFAQDTVVCAEILGHDDVEVHKYAVQITVADVRDGACSSSTLQEAASWGKLSTAMEQMVFAEATSVLPLLASDAWHRGAWRKREKRRFAKLFD
jgi:deoxyhypusine synthase